jgi:type I restriction enzyme S subunit
MKKYDNYKDSGIEWIGQIPEHWEIDKLARVLQIDTGFTPSTGNNEFYDNGEHDWITIRDLKGKYVSESKTKLTDLAVEGKTIIPKGSLLYSFKLSVGQMAFTTKDLFTNEAIFSISPSDNLNLNYFYYLLDRILIHNSNENIYGAKILNQELIKSAKLLVPNSEEQNAIANYLDQKTTQIDQLINQKKRFIELLQEERTAVINQAVTKGLDPTVKMKDSGIEWLGEIPEHWTTYRIDWITNIVRGNTGFKKDELLASGEYLALQYGKTYKVDIVDDSFNFFVNSEFYKESQVVSKGDTILISTSETIEDLGHTCYYDNENIGLLGGEQILLKPNQKLLFEKYLYHYAKRFCLELKQHAKGLKVFRFNTNDLKSIFIAIPKIEKQIQIANFIDLENNRIDTAISKMFKEIELLKEYKTALISEVVTGKVDVREVVLN